MAQRKARFLVFDSGFGGLTVLEAMRRLLPEFEAFYLADHKGFPYGDWDEIALKRHIQALIRHSVEACEPDLVVIACNTASTLVLEELRASHSIPFVGTVPAIKPAAASSQTKMISVLATPATVKREYTASLIAQFAHDCDVQLVPAPALAAMAEACLATGQWNKKALSSVIEPAFQEKDGKRTDAVALACTHYPFLLKPIQECAPWPLRYFDPSEAIARRVDHVWTHDVLLSLAEAAQERRKLLWSPNGYFMTGKPSYSITPALLKRFDLQYIQTVELLCT
jgi:glutamate racemase